MAVALEAALFAVLGTLGAAFLIFQHSEGVAQPAIIGEANTANFSGKPWAELRDKEVEFYKNIGMRISMPVVIPGTKSLLIYIPAINESERRISRFRISIFDGGNLTTSGIVARTLDASIEPQGRISPPLIKVSIAPQKITICASYEGDNPGKFVTAISTADKIAESSDHVRYRQASGWNFFYSDRYADCSRGGHIESIETPGFLR